MLNSLFSLLIILSLEEILVCPQILGAPIPIDKQSVLNDSEEMVDHSKYKLAKDSLSGQLANLFMEKNFADIRFKLSNGQVVDAHKGILCCRSSYFQSMLSCGMLESRLDTIEIQNVEPQVFLAILHFIYTDQPPIHPQRTSPEEAWQLFDAARYYRLERLERVCESYLVNECLCEETATDLWNTAYQWNASNVNHSCKKYYLQHFENIVSHENFVNLNVDLLLIVLSSDDLIVSSQQIVVKAVIIWGKAHTLNPNNPELQPTFSCQEFVVMFFPYLHRNRRWNNNISSSTKVMVS